MTASAATHQGIHVSTKELVALRADAARLLASAPGRAADLFAGDYRALFRGRGLEFDEVRAYQMGDDHRTLDWRVTARTGKLHTKLFKEEREHSLFVVIDASNSMHFGTRVQYKWVAAAKAAAIFIWLAVERGDRVGALVFGDGRQCHMRPPASGQMGALRLFKLLQEVSHEPHRDLVSGACGLSDALARLRRLARPGSSVLVLSDFHNGIEQSAAHLKQSADRHDLLTIRLYDPLERALPAAGRYSIGDGTQLVTLDTSDQAVTRAYEAHFNQTNQALRQLSRGGGMRFFTLGTQQSLLDGLRSGLFPARGGGET